MSRYLEDHPELVGASADTMAQLAIRNVAMMEETERRIQPVLRRFDEQLLRQQKLVDAYRFLSPAILVQGALYDLAGTNTFRYKHFLRLVEEFHGEWRNYFVPKMVNTVQLKQTDIQQMPRFVFREEPSPAVVGRTSVALLGLLGTTAFAGLLAGRFIGRYPVVG